MSNKRLKQGLRAREREANKEQLIMEPITKRVRILTKPAPEKWYRIVNRPGYAFSSAKKLGKIVRDERWMEIEILKVDAGLYGDRVRLSHDGERDYRYVNSILQDAKFLDGFGTKESPAIEEEHLTWARGKIRAMPEESRTVEKIYPVLRDFSRQSSDGCATQTVLGTPIWDAVGERGTVYIVRVNRSVPMGTTTFESMPMGTHC